jgi:deoxyribodipyrimidine photo-lyase
MSDTTRAQVLWFKRDLRVADHAPLAQAAAAGPLLPLVIVEAAYWREPDVSARQWSFLRASIEDLRRQLARLGLTLQVAQGDAIAILSRCFAALGAFSLWSHEETGNLWTWERDRRVAVWCRARGIDWQQRPQFAVWRGARLNRDRWAADWDRFMRRPLLDPPRTPRPARLLFDDPLPSAESLGLAGDGLLHAPAAGRAAALALLDSFLTERGERYTREMSSPATAERACSRLSPHLAIGSLSLREVAQSAWRRAQAVDNDPVQRRWAQSMRSFTARLHWHCHFIQKLDAEPEAQTRPFARICEGLRPRPGDAGRMHAWAKGCTGYPFVDATMRYLIAHGWINFRMRAMLMSFAAYDLWLPWQEAGLHLARMFIDYEPGIHWPQCQMQAGETGINTVRIYSPVKQGHDQDPDGDFVRRWVPELAGMDSAAVHEPWRLGDRERAQRCPDYPPPIVDHRVAARAAKEQIYALRRRDESRAQADAVQRKHGSRRRRVFAAEPAVQGELEL